MINSIVILVVQGRSALQSHLPPYTPSVLGSWRLFCCTKIAPHRLAECFSK
uniref:Uncharacterized protein n=1 Tax=Siphoviridae sp. cthHz3 TaxID=2825614 RepID=A0A8S5UYJ6_9CAUD|nr:MAG TPA: hypothetical protein [Siphoviridae sp. cthHz3]